MWGLPDRPPRRTWRQAVRATRLTGRRNESLREPLRKLAGHNPYSVAFALVVVLVMLVLVLGVVALAGLITVEVAGRSKELQVLVFTVGTLATTAALAFVGKRPWIYAVEVLL